MFVARSTVFYPGNINNSSELSDEIIVPSYYFSHLMNQFNDTDTLYITLTNVETEQTYLTALGGAHTHDKNTIYVPLWILELIGCTGSCDTPVRITKADVSECPVASKIIIRPLDPVAFELNTVEYFEKAFMNLHSIKEGITMTIPVPELGNDYLLYAYIDKVEPEELSSIANGEVAVDFINDFAEKSEPTPKYNPDFVYEGLKPISNVVDWSPFAGAGVGNELGSERNTGSLESTSASRRQTLRDARLKRFQNNATSQ